jgi:arginyl-tRNA synthetase
VLTGDLDRLLAAEIGALRPAEAGAPCPAVTSAGTWQPAPPGGAPAPGTYATPVAFRLAGGGPAGAPPIAAKLAAALRRAGWVQAATVTGGYVTVMVTPDALARLAVRITTAGPACVRSTALAGTTVPAPPEPDLAAAAGWADARRRLAAFLTGRLAEVSGGRTFPGFAAERHSVPGPRATPGTGPVAAAIDFAGAGAIRYALARLPPGAPARVDPRHAAGHRLDVPAYAVRYAHSCASSALRQAADLGLSLGEAAEFDPRLLAHPGEQALLGELSWLPERVAGAARRARPDTFPRYLERIAGAYFDCQEQCPAAWPGMAGNGPQAVARLWLAAATATALRAGLGLLGVDAPGRL